MKRSFEENEDTVRNIARRAISDSLVGQSQGVSRDRIILMRPSTVVNASDSQETEKLIFAIFKYATNDCNSGYLVPAKFKLRRVDNENVVFTTDKEGLNVPSVFRRHRDFVPLRMETYSGGDTLWYFDEEGECVASALVSTKFYNEMLELGNEIEVLLLCARKYHGYGTAMLAAIGAHYQNRPITLNSAPNAIDFYKKIGFVENDPEDPDFSYFDLADPSVLLKRTKRNPHLQSWE